MKEKQIEWLINPHQYSTSYVKYFAVYHKIDLIWNLGGLKTLFLLATLSFSGSEYCHGTKPYLYWQLYHFLPQSTATVLKILAIYHDNILSYWWWIHPTKRIISILNNCVTVLNVFNEWLLDIIDVVYIVILKNKVAY